MARIHGDEILNSSAFSDEKRERDAANPVKSPIGHPANQQPPIADSGASEIKQASASVRLPEIAATGNASILAGKPDTTLGTGVFEVKGQQLKGPFETRVEPGVIDSTSEVLPAEVRAGEPNLSPHIETLHRSAELLKIARDDVQNARRAAGGSDHNDPIVLPTYPEGNRDLDDLIRALSWDYRPNSTFKPVEKLAEAEGLIAKLKTKLVELLNEGLKGAAKKAGETVWELKWAILLGALQYAEQAIAAVKGVFL